MTVHNCSPIVLRLPRLIEREWKVSNTSNNRVKWFWTSIWAPLMGHIHGQQRSRGSRWISLRIHSCRWLNSWKTTLSLQLETRWFQKQEEGYSMEKASWLNGKRSQGHQKLVCSSRTQFGWLKPQSHSSADSWTDHQKWQYGHFASLGLT